MDKYGISNYVDYKNKWEPIWTEVNQYKPIWTGMDWSKPIWTKDQWSNKTNGPNVWRNSKKLPQIIVSFIMGFLRGPLNDHKTQQP